MEFIRPELRAQIMRWREVLIGLFVLVLGVWWASSGLGSLGILGWVSLVAGGGLIAAGVQRARFRTGRGGPGVVSVDEGQLSYFGPLEGGVIAVEDLRHLELEPNARPGPHWVLTDHKGVHLHIPTTAEGAEGLFDVFASLPGIRTEAMLAKLSHAPDRRVTIWQRGDAAQDRRRLH